MQSRHYTTVGDKLNRRGFAQPLLICVLTSQTEYIMKELHEGICGNHYENRTLEAKVLQAGYQWLTIRTGCLTFIKKCDKFQNQARKARIPRERLHRIIAPWPFNTRGLDLCGPFPLTHGQKKFIIVGVDYFIKLIEVEPIVAISAKRVKKFYGKLWYLAMVCHTLI